MIVEALIEEVQIEPPEWSVVVYSLKRGDTGIHCAKRVPERRGGHGRHWMLLGDQYPITWSELRDEEIKRGSTVVVITR